MKYSTYNDNRYNATVHKDNNKLDVKVGNPENKKHIPGAVIEYGVKSVNGKYGDVNLNADDIGAVSYIDEQHLTDEQKLTAQQNIGVDIHSVTDYRNLHDKPQINNVELDGNKTAEELGLLNIQVVNELPTENISSTIIYFVPLDDPEQNNQYKEYVYINDAWELIGTTEVDLTNYYTKQEVNEIVDNYVPTTTTINNIQLSGDIVLSASDVGALPDDTEIPSKTSELINDSGFITGITSSDVTDALGYTPYDSTNPDGFVNASEAANAAPVQSVNGQTGAVTITVPTKTSELTNDSGFVTSSGVTRVDLNTPAEPYSLPMTDGVAELDIGEGLSVSDSNGVELKHATGAGWKHIPSGGTTGQFLGYSADGTASWQTIPVATQSASGLMSSSDKTKLDRIEQGAEVNQNAFSNIKVGSTTIEADSKTDTLTLIAGDNITLTPNENVDSVTISAAAPAYTGTSPINVSGSVISHNDSGVNAGTHGDTLDQTPTWGGTFKALSGTVDSKGHLTAFSEHTVTIPNTVATSQSNGLMSYLDKVKLDNIQANAQVNVLEGINVNGSPVTITNKIATLTVPTKTSDLINDSNFATITFVDWIGG